MRVGETYEEVMRARSKTLRGRRESMGATIMKLRSEDPAVLHVTHSENVVLGGSSDTSHEVEDSIKRSNPFLDSDPLPLHSSLQDDALQISSPEERTAHLDRDNNDEMQDVQLRPTSDPFDVGLERNKT